MRYVRLVVVLLAATMAVDGWRVLVRSAGSVAWSTLLGHRPDILMSASLAGAFVAFAASARDSKASGMLALLGLVADAGLLGYRAARGMALTAALPGIGTGIGVVSIIALGLRARRHPAEERVEQWLRLASAALLPSLALLVIVAGHSVPGNGMMRLDGAMHRLDAVSGVLPSFAIARSFGMAPLLRGAGELVCAAIPLAAAWLTVRQLDSKSRNQIDLLLALTLAGIASLAVHSMLRVDGPMAAYPGAWPWVEPAGPPRGDLPASVWDARAGLVPMTATWMVLCFLEARARTPMRRVAAWMLLTAAALGAVGLGRPWLACLVAPFPVAVVLRAWLAPDTSATSRPRLLAGLVGVLSLVAWTAAAMTSGDDLNSSAGPAWLVALLAVGVSSWVDRRLARAIDDAGARSSRARGHLRVIKAGS